MPQGQIEQRGERTYRIRWFQGRDADGKRHYGSETIKGTLRDAQRRLRQVLARSDQGHAAPSPSTIPTLRAYVKDTWPKSGAAAKLRERTRRDYLEQLERHVLRALGDFRLDAVHTRRIEAEVVAPLREAGKLRTAKLCVAALSCVFRAALKDPALGLFSNPCRGVEVGRNASPRVQPLDAEERARFREAIRGTDHEALGLLMMQTGLGPGEALALGWEHLDLAGATLRVARTLDCKARELVDDAKRPSRLRTLPIPPEVLELLRRRWLAHGRPSEGLVFYAWSGRPLSLDWLRDGWFKPALVRAEIVRPVRIYDLRHGFATAALEAGADVRTVADLMGHSSTTTTRMVYQHVSDALKRETAERVWERLGTSGGAGTQSAPKKALAAAAGSTDDAS